MTYLCLDCSYRSNTKFPGGKCPACDSFNIKTNNANSKKSLSDKNKEGVKESNKKTAVEYFILLLFWGFLLWGIWDRYIAS